MAMIGKVLRMHRRDKKSVREIAQATSLARNTVRKYLRTDRVEEPRRSLREEAPIKLAPFVESIKQALLVDARRPKKERRTAKALLKQISEAGYDGGYSRLTDFIRDWRIQQGGVASGKAFVPLAFELGEAFQFDWSEEGLVIGGIYRRLQVAHMKLCASRAFWLVAYPSQGHEMLFDAHTRSFAALGGVARRGIYDNMRTAVDKVLKGKGRVVNARFAVMCAHYLYDPDTGPRRGLCVAHATSPRAGRRESSRRTCKTAAGASGSTRGRCASAASTNSMPGWASVAGSCGPRSSIPSTSSSASPMCSSRSDCR